MSSSDFGLFALRQTHLGASSLSRFFCGRVGSSYQLDLVTPGISPFSAKLRKHSRQTPNFRRNARGRPHSWQRLCLRLLNFGFRASFTRFAVVAITL
jgi:hypothetical protein